MTEQAQQLELNDDRLINVTLTNSQWNMVTDWFSRIPFDQAHDILKDINDQIEAFTNDEQNKDKQFTASLAIHVFNKIIFALSQAPYFMVAETVQQIYNQGQKEIQRLRDEANGLKSEDAQSEDDKPNLETKPKKTRKAKKTVTKSE